MASNFRISVRPSNSDVEVRLIGDFDGTSACELLNFLRDNCNGGVRVFINTRGLKEIYPFGVDTFQNNLYLLKELKLHLSFTGRNASRIAPERNKFY
jgi:hypothetical protein